MGRFVRRLVRKALSLSRDFKALWPYAQERLLPVPWLAMSGSGWLEDSAIKRPDRYVEMATRLSQEHPDAVFVIAGDGDMAPAIIRMARPLGQKFRMLGWRSDIENLYTAADVVVLTSDNEGMPVSLIEASLAGVVCVTTDVGSASEWLSMGKLASSSRVQLRRFAHGVGRLLDDEVLRERFAEAARLFATGAFRRL